MYRLFAQTRWLDSNEKGFVSATESVNSERADQREVAPPSTIRVAPVTKTDSSEAR
jgi:hypothetical protein